MKFICGPTREEKVKARERWHRWFAWHPVRLESRDCRWLEFIERKGTLYESCWEPVWSYEYRAPVSTDKGAQSWK